MASDGCGADGDAPPPSTRQSCLSAVAGAIASTAASTPRRLRPAVALAALVSVATAVTSLMLVTYTSEGLLKRTVIEVAAANETRKEHSYSLLEGSSGSSIEQSSSRHHHVHHADVLKNLCFWCLMGVVVVCVGIAVAGLETGSKARDLVGGGIGASSDPYSAKWSVQKILHLLYCIIALNVSAWLWGVAQDFVTTNTYDGDSIPSTLFVLFCNRMVSSLFFGGLARFYGEKIHVPSYWLVGCGSISNAISSWCFYRSLQYSSLSIRNTAKSSKLLAVLIISSLRGRQHKLFEYADNLVIVCALVVFDLETTGRELDVQTEPAGVLFLLLLTVADACTPHLQDAFFVAHPEVSTVQLTLAMSSLAAIGLLVELLFSGSVFVCVSFLARHPEASLHLAVLSLASALTQYWIVYTVKHFGPLVFTLIGSTRQVIALCVSMLLFQRRIPALASLAVALVCGLLALRVLGSDAGSEMAHVRRTSPRLSAVGPLLVCVLAIHVLQCSYAVTQEFLAVHTFKGELFNFPVFIVIVNHASGALLAWSTLRLRGKSVYTARLRLTLLPAAANFTATFCQHQALYFVLFPTVTLMKTLKVVPVMVVGRMLRNRRYSGVDYVESALLTALVAYFVWTFQLGLTDSASMSRSRVGGLLMIGYLLADSFTSNLQDFVYQSVGMDAGQMLFGIEAVSSMVACVTLVASGQLPMLVAFLAEHGGVWVYVLVSALTSSCGAYACTLTVRLFGPAVFALVMMSRQVVSLGISVMLFGHQMSWTQCVCMVCVAMLMLISSLRRAVAQVAAQAEAAE